MRVIAIAAILLVGCASRTAGTSSPSNLDQAQESLDRSEVQCIQQAVLRADDHMRSVVMTLGPLTQLQIQEVLLRRDEGARQCQTLAEKGEASTASRERASYENAEALDRRIPVPVLTWSLSPP